MWTLPSLDLDISIVALGCQSKIKIRMANVLEPDETECYKPSHLDPHFNGVCFGWFIPYHTCLKILTNPFYYVQMCRKLLVEWQKV